MTFDTEENRDILIPRRFFEQLLKNGSDMARGKDHLPVVKLHIPNTGCTWLLTEINPQDDDIAFGLCDLSMGFPEQGYVSLEELASIKGSTGIPIKRDTTFFATYPLSIYTAAARFYEQVVTDDRMVAQFAPKLRAV